MNSLTIGGLPGTGTTTVCGLLRDRLGLRYVYTGQLFRDEAHSRGMSLQEFGRLCEKDPSVDRALDDRQVRLLQEPPVLLEGRLAGWLAHQNDLPALKVWITCDDDERVRRVTKRDGGDPEVQRRTMAEREQSEAQRYRQYYGIDVTDLSPYDLVLDSTGHPPGVLAAQIEKAYGAGDA